MTDIINLKRQDILVMKPKFASELPDSLTGFNPWMVAADHVIDMRKQSGVRSIMIEDTDIGQELPKCWIVTVLYYEVM